MAQERKSPSRISVWIVLALVGSLVIAIGCGGGGGGGTTTSTTGTTSATSTSTTSTSTSTTSTSTATTSTATTSTGSTATSTATTSTATTSTGTTSTSSTSGTTTGTVTGILPTNVIIYGTSTIDSNNNLQTAVQYINPDGSGSTSYESYGPNIGIATPNPQKATFAFAYTADPTNVIYDIYSNSTLSTTGATRLTNVGYSSVVSLQYSPDGTKMIFVASVGSDLTQTNLYEMNADGTGLHTIDIADDAYLAGDGVHIAYTRFDSADGAGEIYEVNIDGTNLHAITSYTTNSDDHFGVQLSKDQSHFVWSEAPLLSSGSYGSYDIYTAASNGSQLTQITNLNGDNGLSPTFSPSGTQVAYVDNSSNTTNTGIYLVGVNGLGTATVLLSPNVDTGMFWTSSSGTLSRQRTAPMFGRSAHIAKMKKLGKWHNP